MMLDNCKLIKKPMSDIAFCLIACLGTIALLIIFSLFDRNVKEAKPVDNHRMCRIYQGDGRHDMPCEVMDGDFADVNREMYSK